MRWRPLTVEFVGIYEDIRPCGQDDNGCGWDRKGENGNVAYGIHGVSIID